MNEQIVLSIIVPVYNLEVFLPEALDSLLKIDFEAPYEIIVVDDGSSDGSLEILRAYEEQSKAIRVITGPNGGVSRARNAGIEAARGKYLAFVDGDDTVEPEFFAAAVREMEQDGLDLVQGNTRYLEGKRVRMTLPGSDNIPGGRLVSRDCGELLELFFGRSETLMFSACAKVFRRETIGETRFPAGIRVAEDQKFMFEFLCKAPRAMILDMDAYNYVMRDSSVTHAGYVEKGWDAIRVLEDCEETGVPETIRRYIRKRKTDVLVRIYNTALLCGKDPEKALQEICKTDIREIREDLTGKEWIKLEMIRRCRGIYALLLKALK